MRRIAWFFCLLFTPLIGSVADTDLQQAYSAYAAGERAATLADREQRFNEALDLYQQYEEQDQDGRILTNIANCYFQLGEYPWAILYYKRALLHNPRDERAKANLLVAQEHTESSQRHREGLLENLLYPHYGLSIKERVSALVIATCVLCALWSLCLWVPRTPFKQLRNLGLAVWALLALSVGGSHYLSPVEAILVKPSFLYRDAGQHYDWVQKEPLPAGSGVEVIDTKDSGRWLKIRIDSGAVGFVSAEVARIV